MVNNCCVVGCTNYVGKKKGLGFYRFPLKNKERCSRWEAAVRRDSWKPTSHSRICGDHFITGKPNHVSTHPDYVPSKFPDVYRKVPVKDQENVSRINRRLNRAIKVAHVDLPDVAISKKQLLLEKRCKSLEERQKKRLEKEAKSRDNEKKRKEEKEKENLEFCKQMEHVEEVIAERIRQEEEQEEIRRENKIRKKEEEAKKKEALTNIIERIDDYIVTAGNQIETMKKLRSVSVTELATLDTNGTSSKPDEELMENACDTGHSVVHMEQQTELNGTSIDKILEENEVLKMKLHGKTMNIDLISEDDENTKFFTGLPTWKVSQHLYNFLAPHVDPSLSLSLRDEFLLFLVRLRLGLLYKDLSFRFTVSEETARRIFQKWLEVAYFRLRFLIKWPSREILKENLPTAFKLLYPQCVAIIDCSEIFIDTPLNFKARSQTYSNYKKHNTIKFLISITPCGSISYLSKCWGGRVSDKVITQKSGFLQHIEPGDTVLADRGFTIAEDIALCGAKLEIPAFTRGKPQLSQKEVECSKQLSTVRIHVERVIGQMKKKYRILHGPIPVKLLKHKGDKEYANIDKILTVCGALTNLCKSVV